MSKIKVAHIHTDPKFVKGSNAFESPDIENRIYAFERSSSQRVKLVASQSSIEYLAIRNESIEYVIHEASRADVVVLWGLERIKAYILSKLPPHIMIVWRFFGSEYYSCNHKMYLTDSTLRFCKKNNFLKIKRRVASLGIYRRLRNRTYGIAIEKVMNRIDLFIGLSDSEYQLVKQRFTFDCSFLRAPFALGNIPENKKVAEEQIVILGHSRTKYNNHIDMLENIQEINPTEYRFKVLFSYGTDDDYTDHVRKIAQRMPLVDVVHDFLDTKDFQNLYGAATAFVLNAKRQIAGGNIMTAIRQRVIIYMREDNLYYKDLIEWGFQIRKIDEFYNLIAHGCSLYDEQIAEHNARTLLRLSNEYGLDNFLDCFMQYISRFCVKTNSRVFNKL